MSKSVFKFNDVQLPEFFAKWKYPIIIKKVPPPQKKNVHERSNLPGNGLRV